MAENHRKKILVTGFGPYDIGFEKTDVNPSWEGVRIINKDEIEAKHGVELFIEHLTVNYDEVEAKITKLWENKFDLAVHVGLAKDAECFRLEKQASKGCYYALDCIGYCPVNFEHPLGEEETVLCTVVDIDAVLAQFNAEPPEPEMRAEASEEAGKYLCEYVYYTSLYYSVTKQVLFIHVPLEKYTYEQIARGLERIIDIILSPA